MQPTFMTKISLLKLSSSMFLARALHEAVIQRYCQISKYACIILTAGQDLWMIAASVRGGYLTKISNSVNDSTISQRLQACSPLKPLPYTHTPCIVCHPRWWDQSQTFRSAGSVVVEARPRHAHRPPLARAGSPIK